MTQASPLPTQTPSAGPAAELPPSASPPGSTGSPEHPALHEVTYTPGSGLRQPGRLVGEMWGDLFASRGLAWRLIIRNLSAQFRGAALGWAWAFLPPVAAAGTFILLNATGVIASDPAIGMPYAVFAFVGTILWQSFVDAIQKPLAVVNASRSMLTKINFPREALLLAGIGEVLFNTTIRLLLLVAVLLAFQTPPAWTFPLALLGLGTLILTGTVIGVMLTPIGMLYKDVQQALTMLLGLLMFLTPVGWAVPDAGFRSYSAWINPAAAPLLNARSLLITGQADYLGQTLIMLGVAGVLTLLGWLLYRLAMPILIERIGS
ncbi:MAG: ABC transporter permease [Planctomycetota bacterium]